MRVSRPSPLSLYGGLDQTVRLGGGVKISPSFFIPNLPIQHRLAHAVEVFCTEGL
jgi:hypothetical protein